jgi:hypothetical protein
VTTTIEHDTQQPIESPTTTALAVVTKSIAEINAVDSTIADLESKYRGVVFAVDTAEGMDEARKARAAIREPRYALQNIEKGVKAALNGLKTSVGEQIGPYITRIEAIEDPVHLQIKGQEEREEATRKAKKEAEARRIAAIEERISDIRETVTLAAGKSSEQIQQFITELEAVAVDATFAEFQPRAETAKAATLVKLQAVHKAAVDLEAQQKKLEEERAVLARQQANEQRLARIRARIGSIREFANDLVGVPSIRILQSLETAKAYVIDSTFQELEEEAAAERLKTVQRLEKVYDATVAHEAEVERLAREKAEQDAAAAKERERIAADQRYAETLQRLHNERMEQIRGIERMLLVATRHGTLEGYDLAINELKALTLNEEDYGTLLKDATAARDSTLKALREGRDALNLRLVEEAAAKAENDRLAEANRKLEADRAELDRREQASKLAQETVAPPSDPVEATKDESVQALVKELSAPASGDPTDDEIIEVVARTWFVPETTAIEWIIAVADRQRDMVAA